MSKASGDQWKILLEYKRRSVSEVAIHGAVSWVHGEEVFHEVGGGEPIFGRSLTKPYQMKGLTEILDSVLTPEAKALSVASHMSEPAQMSALQTMLTPEKLQLIQAPSSQPLGPAVANVASSALYHPCSGKHAAILKACEINDWPTANYTSPEHPYHKNYVDQLRKIVGENWQSEEMAKDGCGLPTFAMTVSQLAKLYAALVATRNDDWIWSAVTEHAEIVGGRTRLDTAIMKATGGQVLAKEGADGLLGIAIVHADFPKGLGVVIKTAHGWDPKAMQFLASAVLRVLGFDFPNPEGLDRQQAFVNEALVPKQYAAQIKKITAIDTARSIDDRF